ncbi:MULTISPECIES: hypothetical protein [unclassified Blastococcus]
MSRRTVRAVPVAALVAAVLFTAGCSTADTFREPPIVDSPGVGGLPESFEPAGPPADASGSDQYVGDVDAGALAGPDGDVYAIAAAPGGSVVVLAGTRLDPARPAVLAELVPGPAGPAVRRVVAIRPVDPLADLHVAPDGTVLVLGEPADGGGTLLVRLAPGATQAETAPVDTGARTPYGPAPVEGSALTPDGATLVLTVLDLAGGAPEARLVTVDAATGAATGSRVIDVGTPEHVVATEVAVRPDGGIAVLLLAALHGDGAVDDPVLAGFGPDLRPTGDLEHLAQHADAARGTSLQLLPDGGAAVVVDVVGLGYPLVWLVVVRDGDAEVTNLEPLGAHRPAAAVAVAADGRTAAVPYSGDDGRAGLATVDLGTGAVRADLTTCATEGTSPQAVAVPAGVAVVVQCREDTGVRAAVALVA